MSPREPEGSIVGCLWRFSACLHLLIPFTLPLLSVPASEQRCKQWGDRFWDMYCQRWWMERVFWEAERWSLCSFHLCRRSLYYLKYCFCLLLRAFLQYDPWGEDRRRQQISLCWKRKTCMSLSSRWVFCYSSDLTHCWIKSQVDYGATADELEIHFNGCGPVNRVTILCDRFSGHPKG